MLYRRSILGASRIHRGSVGAFTVRSPWNCCRPDATRNHWKCRFTADPSQVHCIYIIHYESIAAGLHAGREFHREIITKPNSALLHVFATLQRSQPLLQLATLQSATFQLQRRGRGGSLYHTGSRSSTGRGSCPDGATVRVATARTWRAALNLTGVTSGRRRPCNCSRRPSDDAEIPSCLFGDDARAASAAASPAQPVAKGADGWQAGRRLRGDGRRQTAAAGGVRPSKRRRTIVDLPPTASPRTVPDVAGVQHDAVANTPSGARRPEPVADTPTRRRRLCLS